MENVKQLYFGVWNRAELFVVFAVRAGFFHFLYRRKIPDCFLPDVVLTEESHLKLEVEGEMVLVVEVVEITWKSQWKSAHWYPSHPPTT